MEININRIADFSTTGYELEKIKRMDKTSVTKITYNDVDYTAASPKWSEAYGVLNTIHAILNNTLNLFSIEELLSITAFLTLAENDLHSIIESNIYIDMNNALEVITRNTEDYDIDHKYFIARDDASEAWTTDTPMDFVNMDELISYLGQTGDSRGAALLLVLENIEYNVNRVL